MNELIFIFKKGKRRKTVAKEIFIAIWNFIDGKNFFKSDKYNQIEFIAIFFLIPTEGYFLY